MGVSGAKWWKVVNFHNFHQVFHSGVGETENPVENRTFYQRQRIDKGGDGQ